MFGGTSDPPNPKHSNPPTELNETHVGQSNSFKFQAGAKCRHSLRRMIGCYQLQSSSIGSPSSRMKFKAFGCSSYAQRSIAPLIKNLRLKSRGTSLGRADWKGLIQAPLVASLISGPNIASRIVNGPYFRSPATTVFSGLGSEANCQSIPLEERLQQAPVTTIYSPEELDEALELLEGKVVVLQCKAKTCRPCMGFARKFLRLAETYTDIAFLEIYGDESKQTRKMMINYGVKATPTFRLYKSGEFQDTVVGVNQDKIERAIRIVAGLKVDEDEEGSSSGPRLAGQF